MDEMELPHYIDAQQQIFFWEVDEIMPIISFIGVGLMTDTLTVWLLFSIVFHYAFTRFKYSQMDGILMHLVYWHGIMPLNRRFKNGLDREYIS